MPTNMLVHLWDRCSVEEFKKILNEGAPTFVGDSVGFQAWKAYQRNGLFGASLDNFTIMQFQRFLTVRQSSSDPSLEDIKVWERMKRKCLFEALWDKKWPWFLCL